MMKPTKHFILAIVLLASLAVTHANSAIVRSGRLDLEGPSFNVDINNDGTDDFVAQWKTWVPGTPCSFSGFDARIVDHMLFINTKLTGLGSYPGVKAPLDYGALIGPTPPKGLVWALSSNAPMIWLESCLPSKRNYWGAWHDIDDKYLGFVMNLGQDRFYGWIRLDTDSSGNVTLVDYAYDDVPDTPIKAGAVPNPDQSDSDGDGVADTFDNCPNDPHKTEPGICGCDVADTDGDSDGAPDCEEQGPDRTVVNYSGNGDTVPDRLQNNVTSLHTYDGINYVTLLTYDPATLSSCQGVENPHPDGVPSGVAFPYGFFSFIVNNIEASGRASVILYLPYGAAPDTYYKYGPTPENPNDHWYDFLYDGSTGAEINGEVITLYFVDGKRGDDDLDNNGTIVDRGGPGITDGDGGGGGGGCFVVTTGNSVGW